MDNSIDGKTAKTNQRVADIRGFSANEEETDGGLNLYKVVQNLTKSQREELISGYDLKKFAKIFEDESMMRTANAFISNGMNVSKTARSLYMHRNTLMYRLNIIRKNTGLDLYNFDMAVTFKLLHFLYIIK